MAPRQRGSSNSARSAGPVETLSLHPLIRRHLGTVDLRRTEVLRVDENNVAFDVILRNAPVR